MDKELLVKEICDADKKKKKPRRGEHQNDDNSIGKVLRILSNSEGEVHPTDLCQKLEVTTPRITVILNEMEDKGLVERQISKEDRRKILIVLTEKGKEQVMGRRRRAEYYFGRLVDKIGLEDAEAYLRVLNAELELQEELRAERQLAESSEEK